MKEQVFYLSKTGKIKTAGARIKSEITGQARDNGFLAVKIEEEHLLLSVRTWQDHPNGWAPRLSMLDFLTNDEKMIFQDGNAIDNGLFLHKFAEYSKEGIRKVNRYSVPDFDVNFENKISRSALVTAARRDVGGGVHNWYVYLEDVPEYIKVNYGIYTHMQIGMDTAYASLALGTITERDAVFKSPDINTGSRLVVAFQHLITGEALCYLANDVLIMPGNEIKNGDIVYQGGVEITGTHPNISGEVTWY